MKYKSKKIVEAVVYESGMEDGFDIRYCSKEEPNITWGIATEKENIPIDIPYIITYYDEDEFPHIQYVNEGDYIIINDDGTKEVKSKRNFENEFELIENE